jgi:hypothetical protein
MLDSTSIVFTGKAMTGNVECLLKGNKGEISAGLQHYP